ncbi:MAG: MotA/TolQ/ExbB proton channel family protein [Prevotellaceae bacterium]|nr:MotA/TolQ/ExbB proton channel family protein [Prevotellaceae bacterium]
MNLSISTDTWICLGIIAAAFVFCFVFVFRHKNSESLVTNRRVVEYFPSLVSTLGVLGTFWGITKGLMAFDTTDLDNSIPDLLDGLKTAFFTSLAGMIGSMLLSGLISRKQDQKDGGVSDINQAAGEITQAVKK